MRPNLPRPTADRPQTVGFILIPGFALMCYASAVEPLRAANLLAGRELYRVVHFAPNGVGARSSSGIEVAAYPLPARRDGLDVLFVCAGGNPSEWQYPAVLATLRHLAREGVRIGGISGGPYLLAAAGLLEDSAFTIHWEHVPAFREVFHRLQPWQARFVIDRDRITCGGGVSPLDMMHALIAEAHGRDFAGEVSDWFLHAQVSDSIAPQRGSTPQRHGVHHPALITVLDKMEATVEHPLDRSALAALAGISPRHLDRLFRQHMRTTFLAAYRRIRIAQARRLLHQSSLSVSEIAFATGYSSPSHFARDFRQETGKSPSRSRHVQVALGNALSS
jgi:transcriptional regulator GlxA family with amidase domain